MTKYSFLKPYQFKNGNKLNNRIVMAPMTNQSSYFDGSVTNDEINYYRARSGAGIVITAVANIDEGGKGFEGELSVAEDRFIPGLSQLANAIKSNGSKAILQIFSAGRKTNSSVLRGKQPYSASAVKAPRENETPRALSGDEVEEKIEDFGQATLRAIKAGFDGVEIHGANTYLIQQFFSPHSNRRDDKWGGNIDERMKFSLSVVNKVRKVVDQYANDDFIIGYRISPEEVEKPGIRIDDTLQLVDKLSDQPIDYLHTSMGNFRRPSFNNKDDKEPINKKILKQINGRLPLIVVGSIKTPAEAQDALDFGATFAALGREFINEPNWVEKVKSDDENSIRYQLSPNDMDELEIPRGFQRFLTHDLAGAIDFTTSDEKLDDYLNNPAPMENLEKDD